VQRKRRNSLRLSRKRKRYMSGTFNRGLRSSNMLCRIRRCRICKRRQRGKRSMISIRRRLRRSRSVLKHFVIITLVMAHKWTLKTMVVCQEWMSTNQELIIRVLCKTRKNMKSRRN